MQTHLAGSTAIVKNLPGAGHIIGLNEVFHSKPNGLTLGVFDRGVTLAQVAGEKGIKFDLAQMSWLGSFSSDPRVLVIAARRPIDYIGGEKAQDLIQDALTQPPKLVKLLRKAYGLNE